jgi:hypothetical protein
MPSSPCRPFTSLEHRAFEAYVSLPASLREAHCRHLIEQATLLETLPVDPTPIESVTLAMPRAVIETLGRALVPALAIHSTIL